MYAIFAHKNMCGLQEGHLYEITVCDNDRYGCKVKIENDLTDDVRLLMEIPFASRKSIPNYFKEVEDDFVFEDNITTNITSNCNVSNVKKTVIDIEEDIPLDVFR